MLKRNHAMEAQDIPNNMEVLCSEICRQDYCQFRVSEKSRNTRLRTNGACYANTLKPLHHDHILKCHRKFFINIPMNLSSNCYGIMQLSA
jgi:hypothetical protein